MFNLLSKIRLINPNIWLSSKRLFYLTQPVALKKSNRYLTESIQKNEFSCF
jgi:hypothetical protein